MVLNRGIGPTAPGIPSGGVFGYTPTLDPTYDPSSHAFAAVANNKPVNVLDYGAGVVGVTDDHPAILQAQVAAGWTGIGPVRPLYFPAPPRGYYIDATSQWPNPPDGSLLSIISDPGVVIYKAHQGNLIFTRPVGTALTTNSPGTNTGDTSITIENAGWVTNQWVGYQIEVTGAGGRPRYQRLCVANDDDTIQFDVALGANPLPAGTTVMAYLPWADTRLDGFEVRGLTQTVTISGATGGTFALTYLGQSTGPLAYNASAATVQAALQGLSTIGAGNITVTLTGGGAYLATWNVAFYHGVFNLGNEAILSADATLLTGTTPRATVSGSASNIVIFFTPHLWMNVGSRYSIGGDNISVNRSGWVNGGVILDAYMSGAVFCMIVYDCDGIDIIAPRVAKWVNGFGAEIKDCRNCHFISGMGDLRNALFGMESVPIAFEITCSGVNPTYNCSTINCWGVNAPLSTPLNGIALELIALHSEGSLYNADNYQIRGGGAIGCPGAFSVQASGGASITNAGVSGVQSRYCTQVGGSVTNPGTQLTDVEFDHCTLDGLDILTSDVTVRGAKFANNNYNAPWTITAATWLAGQATITLGVYQGAQPPTAFAIGETVNLSGFTPGAWNGRWVVAAVTGTSTGSTVTLTMAADPGAVTVLGLANIFQSGAGIRILSTIGPISRTTIDAEFVHDDPLSATVRAVQEIVVGGNAIDYTLIQPTSQIKDLVGGFAQDYVLVGAHSQAFASPNGSIFAGAPAVVAQPFATSASVTAAIAAGASGIIADGTVRMVAATALPANTYNPVTQTLTGNANGILTVDGVLVTGPVPNRILVAGEATASHNGIYLCTQLGSSVGPYILTRAPDGNSSSWFPPGRLISVSEGTTNAATVWQLTTIGPIVLDTTALNWTVLPGAHAVPTTRQIIAGTGLTGGGDLTADRTLAVTYGTAAGTALQGNAAASAAGWTANGDLATTGHVIGTGNGTPTIAVGANLGTTATASVVGSDNRGTITLNSSGTGQASGIVATVTFAHAYGSTPVVVAGAGTTATAGRGPAALGTSTTTFVVLFNVAPAAGATYTVTYIVEG